MALYNMPQTDSLMREAQHMHDVATKILEVYAPDSDSPQKGNPAAMEALITQTMMYFERELRSMKMPNPLGTGFEPKIHPPF